MAEAEMRRLGRRQPSRVDLEVVPLLVLVLSFGMISFPSGESADVLPHRSSHEGSYGLGFRNVVKFVCGEIDQEGHFRPGEDSITVYTDDPIDKIHIRGSSSRLRRSAADSSERVECRIIPQN